MLIVDSVGLLGSVKLFYRYYISPKGIAFRNGTLRNCLPKFQKPFYYPTPLAYERVMDLDFDKLTQKVIDYTSRSYCSNIPFNLFINQCS